MERLCFPVSYVDSTALIVVLTGTVKRNQDIPVAGDLPAHPTYTVLLLKRTSSHRPPRLCFSLSLSFLLQ